MSLPYYAGVSEDIARLLKSKGISSSFNCRGSMRETLVKPKDQLEKEQDVGVLYWLGCAGHNSIPCPGTYVGETERTAHSRSCEPPGRFSYYSKFFSSLGRSRRAYIKIQSLKNISSGSFWEKSLFMKKCCIRNTMSRMQHANVAYATSCCVCNTHVSHMQHDVACATHVCRIRNSARDMC